MRIICTGISGSGVEEYLAEVNSIKPIKIFDIGREIFDIAEKQGRSIQKTKVLDKPDNELDPYRAAAFEKVLRETANFEDFIVRTHACFRWKNILRKAFDLYYLEMLKPDLYINIIDSVANTRVKLEQNLQWSGRLSLKDIIIWRDEEIVLTSLMASYQKKKFFIIAREEPPATFLNVVFNDKMPKIYLSYPISHMSMKREEWLEEKDKVRDKLRKSFIVFDPLDIRDVEFLNEAQMAKKNGAQSFTYKVDGVENKFDTVDVLDIENDIFNQTVTRDFRLIDQSDMVVSLYPEPVRSHGVSNEIKYGSINKDVFIITPLGKDPFTEFDITERFSSEDELICYLKEKRGK